MRGLKAAALLAASAMLGGGAFADDLWSRDKRPTLLTADQAFSLVSAERGVDGIRVHWDIAPGYFLYRDPLRITAMDGASLTLKLPPAEIHHDAELGDSGIYRLTLNVVVTPLPNARPPTRLRLRYQGCADAGLCYPPQDKEIAVTEDSH